MKYADGEKCPSCREMLNGTRDVCPSCEFRLNTFEAAQLWQSLKQADLWLARGLSVQEARPVVPVAGPPVPVTSYAQPYPSQNYAPSRPVKPPRKPIDTGAVLLVLGALFLMVAGSIASALFLGVFALPLMAIMAGALGFVTDRRGLKASTETMLVITAAMTGLTFGLFMWDSNTGLFIWSLLAFAISFGFVQGTKNIRDYASPKVFMALALIPLATSAQSIIKEDLSYQYSWDVVALAIMLAGFAALGLHFNVKYYKVFSLFMAGLYATFALLASYGEFMTLNSPKDLYFNGHGYPLLIVTAAVGASIYAIANLKLRMALFALAYFLTLSVIGLSISGGGHDKFAIVALMAIALAGLSWKHNYWFKKILTYVSLAPAAIGLLVFAGTLAQQLERASSFLVTRYRDWDSMYWSPQSELWFPLTLMALAAASLAIIARHESFALAKSYSRWLLPPWAGLAFFVTVLYLFPNNFTLPASLLLAGVLASAGTRTMLAGGTFIAVAPWLTLAYSGTSSIMFLSASIALFALAFLLKDLKEVIWLALAAASFYFTMGLLMVGIYYNYSSESHTLLAAVAIALMILASSFLSIKRPQTKYSMDAGLALPIFATLVVAVGDNGASWLSLLALIIGASSVAASFINNNRIHQAWGILFVGLSWVARLVASDIETPEAYTAPFAITLLIFGYYKMIKNPQASSWQYMGPGLMLSLLSSIPWILNDPVTFRALALAFVASIMLFVGINNKWQALVILPAICLGGLALVELGPYLLMVSRWLLIGGFGIIFVALGVTFEQRVKDGKALAAYLSTMR